MIDEDDLRAVLAGGEGTVADVLTVDEGRVAEAARRRRQQMLSNARTRAWRDRERRRALEAMGLSPVEVEAVEAGRRRRITARRRAMVERVDPDQTTAGADEDADAVAAVVVRALVVRAVIGDGS